MTRIRTLVHKRTVVRAVTWDDTDEARAALRDLGYAAAWRYQPVRFDGPRTLIMPTAEGDRYCQPGHIVIDGVAAGNFYPIPPDVEALSYDELVEAGVS